ncbi:MAG: MFS transporter [Verrucomicrobiota bacterium]
MNTGIRNKLFLMMVLEFFIWGAWLPLIFGYLPAMGLSEGEQTLILSAFPVAAIIGMFFSNQFADRNFAAEKFMAFSHFVGGLAMAGLAFVKFSRPELAAGQTAVSLYDGAFWLFFGLMALHCLLYVPTISIANSIAFSHMKSADKEFGIVRMGGTVGWILAAWPIAYILHGKPAEQIISATGNIFIISGVASLVLALFSLTLPHTPANKAAGSDNLAWLKATKLLAIPAILILFIATFIDATIHNGYFVMAGGFIGKVLTASNIDPAWTTVVMSIGQVAEILTMIILGGVLAKLGWRTTLVLGILGHTARFLVFAYCPTATWLIIVVQLLHGVCYAFFFATVYIYIDAVFPKDIRTSAQGLFNFLILGVGDLAAKLIFIPLSSKYITGTGFEGYRQLFLVPVLMSLGAAVLLALFFRPVTRRPETNLAAGAAPH